MRALFEARLEHLGPGDLVQVECVCGHVEMLTATMLASAGVQPYENIQGLRYKLRCRECDAKGKAIVSIRWVKAPDKWRGALD